MRGARLLGVLAAVDLAAAAVGTGVLTRRDVPRITDALAVDVDRIAADRALRPAPPPKAEPGPCSIDALVGATDGERLVRRYRSGAALVELAVYALPAARTRARAFYERHPECDADRPPYASAVEGEVYAGTLSARYTGGPLDTRWVTFAGIDPPSRTLARLSYAHGYLVYVGVTQDVRPTDPGGRSLEEQARGEELVDELTAAVAARL